MKKLFFLIPATLLFACSTDSDKVKEETDNNPPVLTAQSFAIDEHSEVGTSIGSISASDSDNDALTFTINSESGLEINEDSGEITLGNNLVLDYEASKTLPFTVSVFDGKAIAEQAFELTINDISEFDLLSDAQKETIAYYQYLTLWEAPTNSSLDNTNRWMEPMKLYLDGQISAQFRTNVEEVINEYNTIFENSDFSIALVETLAESNAHLYFGDTNDIEGLWDDMFEIIDGKTFAGYAISSTNNSVLSNSRIWVSSPLSILFKHEMGHALGFGHSEKCEMDSSFMCSSIDPEHDFLAVEKEIIGYAYANDMEAGLTAEEIKTTLANKLYLEN